MGENDLKSLKTEFPDIAWKNLMKKIAYPYEYSNSFDDYRKPVLNLKKEDFFKQLKNDYPSDDEIEKTKGIIEKIEK